MRFDDFSKKVSKRRQNALRQNVKTPSKQTCTGTVQFCIAKRFLTLLLKRIYYVAFLKGHNRNVATGIDRY